MPVRLSASDAALLVDADRRPLRLSIADLPIFATLGVRGPAMVLGLDCLAAPKAGAEYGARVVLSARDGLVWLEALS